MSVDLHTCDTVATGSVSAHTPYVTPSRPHYSSESRHTVLHNSAKIIHEFDMRCTNVPWKLFLMSVQFLNNSSELPVGKKAQYKFKLCFLINIYC